MGLAGVVVWSCNDERIGAARSQIDDAGSDVHLPDRDGGVSDSDATRESTTDATDADVANTHADGGDILDVDADAGDTQGDECVEMDLPVGDVFDASKVYIFGTIAEGSCGRDVIAPWDRPNVAAAGFSCNAYAPGAIVQPISGRFLYRSWSSDTGEY